MVGKHIDHPSGKIERWKNRRYRSESTKKYQKDEDSTKIGGTGTKIDVIKSVFLLFDYNQLRVKLEYPISCPSP